MGCVFSVEDQRKIIYAGRSMSSNFIQQPAHTLDTHVLSYVLDGEWHLQVDNQMISAKKDSVFLLPAKVLCQKLKPCPTGTTAMYIHFSPNPSDRFTPSVPEDIQHPHIYVNTLVDTSNNPEVKRNFIRLIEGYNADDKVRQTAHLNIILSDLSKSYLYEDSEYALGIKIKKMINDAIPESLSNREIASRLNIGTRTAETAFKKSFGMSMHQYMIHQKIELSKFWLRYYPEQKIADTAEGHGFYDTYHFSRQFKKITGMSPSQYRNLFINQNPDK